MSPDTSPAPRLSRLEDPFQSSWQQEFWYREPVREKRLNLLLHLAPYSAVLLLTGDEGSGKTTLMRQFLLRAQDTWRICQIQGAADLDDLGLLDRLDEELSLRGDPHADLETRIANLRDSLHALRRGSLIPLVIVDDAHLLPQAALTMLGRLTEPREDGSLLLGALLCGESSIEERFAMPGLGTLRERVSHSFDLPPLGEEATTEYIRHRMRAAGQALDGPFTPAVFRFIHVASRGLPARINELARGVLRNEGQDEPVATLAPRTSTGRTLLRYGLAALAISLVIVALFYQDTLKEYAVIDPLPGESPAMVAPWPDPEADTSMDLAALAPEAPPAVADADQEAVGGEPPEATPEPETLAIPAVVDAPEPETVIESANGGEPAPAPGPETAPEPEPAPVPDAESGSRSEPGTATGERDARWLLAQPPGHFTLQLFASSEERARAFIERHGLAGESALFRSTAGERPLYSVVYGIYPNRQAAVQAGREGPVAAIDGVEPWVRALRDIHAVITRAGTEP